MTYRWEPTTPLDRILAIGFKRIDEAVEGVIARYPPVFCESEVLKLELENTRRLLDLFHNPVYPCRYHNEPALQKEYNRQMSMIVERAQIDQPDLEDFWHNAQKRYNYQRDGL